jgi:hypothetical protein
MKNRIKAWLQSKLKSWVFDGENPYVKTHKVIHTPTETLKLRSTSRYTKTDLQDMHNVQGLSESRIIEIIKTDLLQDLFKHLKDSGAIEIIQYEEPLGISMNGQGIHFEAKLMVVKSKQ